MNAAQSVGVPATLAKVVAQVRSRQPLVHCLTNTVSMALVADGLLAAGARPMMTETLDEAPAMTAHADALLVNLGTLSSDARAGMRPTVEASCEHGHPWVLDPTAVGVGPVRTVLARELLALGPAAVRGNASEVRALAGQAGCGRGADSVHGTEEARDAAQGLAAATGAVVAVSGARDLIAAPGGAIVELCVGHPVLTRVTGTGCLLGALTAACVAVSDPWAGALAASAWLGVAGEQAAAATTRPGSFRVALLDALDAVAPGEVAAGAAR